MHKKYFVLLLVAILALSSILTASAQSRGPINPLTPPPSAENGQLTNESNGLWYVELSSPPTADGTSLTTVKAEKVAFRSAAKLARLNYKERYAFDTLWNGFSISMPASELPKLKSIAGVKNIYPVMTISIPKTTVSDPELYTALSMTGADIVQSSLGFTGAGIKVAVMDTGIDVNHPAFGGNGVAELNSSFFYSSPRIKYGYDLVGDAYNADPTSPSYSPIPVPDPIPDDCAGHGTHVAGIIGANDSTNNLKGVAPDVTFGAYRVFGCQGSTTDDVMIAAMEMALKDKMQVLNMSIGSAYQWPQYPSAVASSNLVKMGMVVVASIGNSGANGLYSAGAPGLGDKVIGVASFDNTNVAQAAFSISPDNLLIGYNPAAGAPPAPVTGSLDIAAPTPVTACPVLVSGHYVSPFTAGSLTGKAVLVNRGTCSFYWKARFAQEAGAAAVIIANNTAGQLNPTVDPAGGAAFTPIPCPHADFPTCPAITVPTVAILQSSGTTIRTRLVSGPVQMTWTSQTVSSVNSNGGMISSFSSYGLSPDLVLKPDIGAPGGSIWSSYPLELGGYASLSGTSMASPHVAGAVALYLQAFPNTKAADVNGIFQNNAVPKLWSLAPGYGLLDNVHRQGAGMLRIDSAILATTRITPAKLSVGESEAGPQTFVLTLANNGSSDVTYDLDFVNALSTGGVMAPTYWDSDAVVTFSVPSVTVPAGKTASVSATITPATYPIYPTDAPDGYGQYGGYIVFTPQGSGQVYRVPFAGFVGDYQSIQALTPTSYGLPWLTTLSGCTKYVGLECVVGGIYTNQPAGATYTMTGTDFPYIILHLNHQVSQLIFEIHDAATGKLVHPVFNRALDLEFMGRNSTSTSFFAFPWDGTRIQSNGYNGKGYDKNFTKPLPNGQYVMVVKVLKALGDPNNPAHWETWTSPVITIARPATDVGLNTAFFNPVFLPLVRR